MLCTGSIRREQCGESDIETRMCESVCILVDQPTLSYW